MGEFLWGASFCMAFGFHLGSIGHLVSVGLLWVSVVHLGSLLGEFLIGFLMGAGFVGALK
jgi:hypothetical protein